MPLPGKEPRVKRVHRLVILPDYQGAGFGVKFLNEIAKHYKKKHYRFTIVTSAPSLIYALRKSVDWVTKRVSRLTGGDKLLHNNSKNRITGSFELK
jgi:GNAT superfamily N-acetyltransferase